MGFRFSLARPAPVWLGRVYFEEYELDATLACLRLAFPPRNSAPPPQGCERVATLTPAGPNTFVWTASCPAQMLASRGLAAVQEPGGEGGEGQRDMWALCLGIGGRSRGVHGPLRRDTLRTGYRCRGHGLCRPLDLRRRQVAGE